MLCEQCGQQDATVHLNQLTNGRSVKVDLCEVCSKGDGYMRILEDKIAQLPDVPYLQHRQIAIAYVVMEVEKGRGFHEGERLSNPVAVFHKKKDAVKYIRLKRELGYLRLDWAIVETPLDDLHAEL